MLIDTHCHLHDLEWFTSEQQAEFLQNARENGVEKIICIGTNHEDSLKARDFAAEHPGVYWTYGIHPEFANGYNEGLRFSELGLSSSLDSPRPTGSGRRNGHRGLPSLSEGIRTHEEEERVSPATAGADDAPREKMAAMPYAHLIAIGEIGLDYHYSGYDRAAQIKLFEQMLQLASDHNLPVSLHLREAFADAFAVLDNFPQTRGVVHSFTGSKKELKRALERGFYIGVNGLATYTTPPLPPLDRIVLETDAPFLTPVPFRGTINKPGYVKQIAAYLATKLGVTELEIAEQTTKNARQIFKI